MSILLVHAQAANALLNWTNFTAVSSDRPHLHILLYLITATQSYLVADNTVIPSSADLLAALYSGGFDGVHLIQPVLQSRSLPELSSFFG